MVPNPLSVEDLVPNFKNFGEDVYRALRDECDVSIHEIDTKVSEFHVRRLPKSEVRSIAAKIRKILEKHRPWLPDVDISEVPDDNEA